MQFQMRSIKGRSLEPGEDFVGGELYNKATRLLQEQKFKESLEAFEDLLALWKDTSFHFNEVFRAYNNMGLCYLQLGNRAEALYLFQLALKIKPDYEPAKNNLKIFQRDPEQLHFEMAMRREFGENWREIADQRFAEREEKAWESEKVEKLCTEEIVSKLKSFHIETHEQNFMALAQEYFSSEDLAEKEWYPRSTAKGWDEDFIWMAADVLWKRWRPHKPSLEMLDDEIEALIDQIESLEKRKKTSSEALLPLYRQVSDLIKRHFIFNDSKQLQTARNMYDRWITSSGFDLHSFLVDTFFFFKGHEFHSEAMEIADFFFDLSEDPLFLEQKAEILYESGRQKEALEVCSKTLQQFPEDFFVHLNTGGAFFRFGENEVSLQKEGILLLEKAFCIAERRENKRERSDFTRLAAERLCGVYKAIGNSTKLEEMKKILKDAKEELRHETKAVEAKIEEELKPKLLCQSALDYHQVWEEGKLSGEKASSQVSLQKAHSKKISRNDPCPCGSERKYKKCCLSTQEKEKGEKIARDRVEDNLREKILRFVKNSIPQNEWDRAQEKFEAYLAGTDLERTEFDESVSSEDLLDLEFFDYFIHSYKAAPPGLTVLELFAGQYANLLDPLENELLKSWLTHRFGLWEVQDFSPGEWMTVQDLLAGQTYKTFGKNSSRRAEPYQIFIGRLESTDGQGGFTGSSLVLPRRMKESLLQTIRTEAEQAGAVSVADFVHTHPLKIKEIVRREFKNKKTLLVLDWDGYPLKMCEALFRVRSYEKILEWLDSRGDFLVASQEGRWVYNLLQKGESAGQPPPHTVSYEKEALQVVRSGAECIHPETGEHYRTIANLEITQNELKVFAVSEARFDYCLSLLQTHLHPFPTKLSEQRLEMEEAKKMERTDKKNQNEIPPSMQKRFLHDYFKDYYRNWVDEPIPALDHMTPRQALHHPEGREKLKELLKDFIQMDFKNENSPSLQNLFKELKIQPEELGLKI